VIPQIPDAKLVAVCDSEPLMAEQLAARYGVRNHYSNFIEMLEREQPDIVHITAPPHAHIPLAKAALQRRCHVLVEKPVACSAQETRALLDLAQAMERKVTVAWSYFFDPVARLLRESVRAGEIGAIVHVSSHLGYDLGGPFGRSFLSDAEHWVHQLPGKLIHNVADHLFNKVAEYVEDRTLSFYADAWCGRSGVLEGSGVPDELRVQMRDARISASVTFSANTRPVLHRFEIHGTEGSVRADFVTGTLTREAAPKLPGVIGRLSAGYANAFSHFSAAGRNLTRLAQGDYGYLAGLHYLIASFYDSVRYDLAVPIPYDLILRVASLVDGVVSTCEIEECETKLQAS
jgi:predicted dehydrogenase